MSDRREAARLAQEGLDAWTAGRLDAARLRYEAALALAPPDHIGLATFHGGYAGVLNALGRHADATVQMEQALAAEIAQGHEEGSPPLCVARYFLSEQLLRVGERERALATLAPSLLHAPDSWLTRVAEARALHALGRQTEARDAAALAVAHAPGPDKAAELRQYLGDVFDDPAAG
jgi:tetratricopeptide (TPR) repeat protein